MGVVKNLMVRVGADVNGLVGGMRKASKATGDARQSIKNSTDGIKKAVKTGFDGSGMSIKQFSDALQQTKQANQTARSECVVLGKQLQDLQGVYTTVSDAMAGLDPGKSLQQQLTETEEALVKIERRRRELETQTAGVSVKKQKTAGYQQKVAELDALAEKSRVTEARLESLNQAADKLSDVKGFDMGQSLDGMRAQFQNLKNQLASAQNQATATGRRLKEMGSVRGFAIGRSVRTAGQAVGALGTTAAAAARGGLQALGGVLKKLGPGALSAARKGVQALGRGLKSIASAAGRGIASVPGKLLGIGKAARSGTGGLKGMVRQIRNMGAVSLGLKLVSGTFGRLRSVISSYISSNDELNASVSLLKNQLGKALEPAIRLVITVMQKLVPVAQKAASVASAVLKSIIGDIGDVQYAFRNLGTYGFDQIEKADEEETEDSTGEEQSKLVQKLTGWIGELKKAFTAGDWEAFGRILGGGLRDAIDAVDLTAFAGKLGSVTNAITTALEAMGQSLDIGALGGKIATGFNALLTSLDMGALGQRVGAAAMTVPRLLTGLLEQLDFAALGRGITEGLQGLMDSASAFFEETNWSVIGSGLKTLTENIDWGGLVAGSVEQLHSVVTGISFTSIGEALADILSDIFRDVDFDKLGQSIGTLLGALPKMLTGFVKKMDWSAVGRGISQALKGLTESIDWDGMFSDAMEAVTKVLEGLDMEGIVQSMDPMDALKQMLGRLNTFVAGLDWKGIGKALTGGVSFALEALSAVFTEFDWAALGMGLADSINGIDIGQIIDDLTKTVSDLLVEALDLLNGFIVGIDWLKLGQDLFGCLDGLFENLDLAGLLENVASILGSLAAGAVQLLVGYVSEGIINGLDILGTLMEGWNDLLEENGGDVGAALLAGIGKAFSGISDWLNETVWQPFKSAFVDSFDGMGEQFADIFEKLKEAIKGPINGIIRYINGLLDGVTAGINKVIDGLNGLSVKVPDYGIFGDLAGATIGFNIPRVNAAKIPELATGGVVTGRTTAVVGEKGKEAVVPLEQNTGWMDKFADKVTSRVSGGGNGQPMVLQIFLGKRKLTEYVIEDINQITRSTGVCPINV